MMEEQPKQKGVGIKVTEPFIHRTQLAKTSERRLRLPCSISYLLYTWYVSLIFLYRFPSGQILSWFNTTPALIAS